MGKRIKWSGNYVFVLCAIIDSGILCRSFSTTIPRSVMAFSVIVVFTVRFVVLVIIRNEIM